MRNETLLQRLLNNRSRVLLACMFLIAGNHSLMAQSLTVSGTVTHSQFGQNNGSISLSITSGTAPYTYAWSNSATTSSINGLAAAIYDVTITDASDTIIQSYEVSTYAAWGTLIRLEETSTHVVQTDGSPEDTTGDTPFGFGVGANELPQDSPGGISFDFDPDSSYTGIVGLMTSPFDEYVDPEYIWIVLNPDDDGNIYLVTDAETFDMSYLGTWDKEQLLHLTIETDADSIYIYKNGMLLYSYAHTRGASLYPVVYPFLTDSKVDAVTCNFGDFPPLVITDQVHHTEFEQSNGSIVLTAVSGSGITYNWSNTGKAYRIVDIDEGEYSVTVNSYNGTFIKNYNIYTYAIWDSLIRIYETTGHVVTVDGDPADTTVDFPYGYGIGSNELDPDSTGDIEFDFEPDSSYSGIVGLMTEPYDQNQPQEYLWMFINPDNDGGLYFITDVNTFDMSYLGQWDKEQLLSLRLNVDTDSIHIFKNGDLVFDFAQSRSNPIYPVVLPFADGSKVDGVATNLHPRIKPPYPPAPQTVCSDTPYVFTFDSLYTQWDSIEWATNDSFTASIVVPKQQSIIDTVPLGETDTIWMRSKTSGGLTSESVYTIVSVHSAYPNIISNSDSFYCFQGISGYINLQMPEPDSNYTFLWSNSDSTQNISGLDTGQYTVIISHVGGCTDTITQGIQCKPGCGIDQLELSCVKCGSTNTTTTHYWNIELNYGLSNGSQVSISALHSTITGGETQTINKGNNYLFLEANNSGSDPYLYDTLTISAIDSITGDTCIQTLYTSLGCSYVDYFQPCLTADVTLSDSTVQCLGFDSLTGQPMYMATLSFNNTFDRPVSAHVIKGIGTLTTEGTYSMFPSGSTIDTIFFIVGDTLTSEVCLIYGITDTFYCPSCSKQLCITLPASEAPVFISGNSFLCKGDTACYIATVNNDAQIYYTIVSGTATVDSLTGCVHNINSDFTVRAVATLGCTSVYTDMDVEVGPHLSIIPSDTLIWTGDSVTLHALGGANYEWPGLGLDTFSVNVLPSSDSSFYSVVGSYYGCVDTVSALVRTTDTLILSVVNAPDSVSPYDSTDMLISANVANTNIIWTRNNIDSVQGDTMGYSGTVSALLKNMTQTPQAVEFEFTGSNSGHSAYKSMQVGYRVSGSFDVEVHATPSTVSACTGSIAVTTEVSNPDGASISYPLSITQQLPIGFIVLAGTESSTCATGVTHSTSVIGQTTTITWVLTSAVSLPCTLSENIAVPCGFNGGGNLITTNTDPNNQTPNITNSLIAVTVNEPRIKVTVDDPSNKLQYALLDESGIRTWKVCGTLGAIDNLSLAFTNENEITFNSTSPSITGLGRTVRGASSTIFYPGNTCNTIALTSFNIITLMGHSTLGVGECIYIDEKFEAVSCSDLTINSKTQFTAQTNCSLTNTSCSSPVSIESNVIVHDDYDDGSQTDLSPLQISAFNLVQGGTNVTSTGGIDICASAPSSTITLQYKITNPVKSVRNAALPLDANYKNIDVFSTSIDPCMFNTSGLSVTITDAAGANPVTLNPSTDYQYNTATGILDIHFANAGTYARINENTSYNINISGIEFNAACPDLLSCELPLHKVLLGRVGGPTLSYYTMCGHFNRIQRDMGSFVALEANNTFGHADPRISLSSGQITNLFFSLESNSGISNPWAYESMQGVNFFDCPDLHYQIVLTLPINVITTNTGFVYTTVGGIQHPIPAADISGPVLTGGFNVYTINDNNINGPGELALPIELLTNPACDVYPIDPQSPVTNEPTITATARFIAICDEDCATVGYCAGEATNVIGYHCNGECTGPISTNDGAFVDANSATHPIILERIPVASEIVNSSLIDLHRAYPCDLISVLVQGSTLLTSGITNIDHISMELSYDDPLSVNMPGLIVQPSSIFYSLDNVTWVPIPMTSTTTTVTNHHHLTTINLPGGCNGSVSSSNNVSAGIYNSSLNTPTPFYVKLQLRVPDLDANNATGGIYELLMNANMRLYSCAGGSYNSCDSRSEPLELIGHDYTIEYGFIEPDEPSYDMVNPPDGDICSPRFFIRTKAIGGIPQTPEMPGELRPLIVWPDDPAELAFYYYNTEFGINTGVTPQPARFMFPTITSTPINVSVTEAINTPPTFSRATFTTDNTPNAWHFPRFGKTGLYAMQMVARFDRKICLNASNSGTGLDFKWWTRTSANNGCNTPHDYFYSNPHNIIYSNNDNRIKIPRYLGSNEPTSGIKLFDDNNLLVNNVTIFPNVNEFTIDGQIVYSGPEPGTSHTWFEPDIYFGAIGNSASGLNVSADLNGSSLTLTSSQYYSSGPIDMPPGVNDISFSGTFDPLQGCPVGNYVIDVYSGYTCHPNGSGTPTSTSPLNGGDVCTRKRNRIVVTLRAPQIDHTCPSGCISGNASVAWCTPTTFNYFMTPKANTNWIFNPSCNIEVPADVSLSGVDIILTYIDPVTLAITSTSSSVSTNLPFSGSGTFTDCGAVMQTMLAAMQTSIGGQTDVMSYDYQFEIRPTFVGLNAINGPRVVRFFGNGEDMCGNPILSDELDRVIHFTSVDFTADVNACNGDVEIHIIQGHPNYQVSIYDEDNNDNLDYGPTTFTSTAIPLIAGLTQGHHHRVEIASTNSTEDGCTATEVVYIPTITPISITATVTDAICSASNGAIDITASDGTPTYSYSWSNSQTTEDISSLGAGGYTVTVTDANGCTATSTYSVTVTNYTLTITETVTDAYCVNNDGAIDISVTGGTPTYSYNWSNSQTTEDISSLGAGSYTVTVTDVNSCSASSTFNVNADSPTFTFSDTHTDLICSGATYGYIDLTVIGGNGPYTYSWSNSETTEDISMLTADTYVVTITDQDGCTASDAIIIDEDNTCCSGDEYINTVYSGDLTFENITSTQLSTILGLPYDPNLGHILLLGNTKIAFNGTFTIDEPEFTILNSDNVTFGPGAEIIVDALSTLNISHSTLYACSDYLWKGINVNSGTGPTCLHCGGVLYMGWSEIRDAQYAIQAQDKSYVEFYFNTFRNNFIGFYANGGANTTGGAVYHRVDYVGNTFYGGPLLSAYSNMQNATTSKPVSAMTYAGHAWAGVLVDNISLLRWGLGNRLAYRNYFRGQGLGSASSNDLQLTNGIVSVSSSLNVLNSNFYYIKPYHYLTLPIGTNNGLPVFEYNPGGYGIHATGANRGTTTRSLTQTGMGMNSTSPISFDDCSYGIFTDKMNVSLSNNRMEGSYPTTLLGAGIEVRNKINGHILITKNRITGTGSAGVRLSDNTPTFQTEISYNNITQGAYHGIVINETGVSPNSNSIVCNTIKENVVTMNSGAMDGISLTNGNLVFIQPNYIHLTNPATNYFGLNLQGGKLLSDLHNIVWGISADVGAYSNTTVAAYPRGFNYVGCNNSLHQCNTAYDLYTGYRFGGINAGVTFSGNSINTPSSNVVNTGLWVDGSGTISPQYHAGNKWFGTYNSIGARNDNISNISYMIFSVELTIPPTAYTPPSATPTWFFPDGYPDVDPCPVGPHLPSTGTPAVNAMMVAIAQDSLTFEAYNTELKWQNSKWLYELAYRNPSILDSDTIIALFYYDKSETAIDHLTRVDGMIQNALMLDSDYAELLASVYDSIDTINAQLLYIDSTLSILYDPEILTKDSMLKEEMHERIDNASRGSLGFKDTVFLAFLDSVTNFKALWISDTMLYDSLMDVSDSLAISLTNLQNYIDSLQQLSDSLKMDKIDGAIDSNNAITVTEWIESGYKTMNDIYLNTLAKNITEFDSTQSAMLYYWAFKCPYEGGDAVFKARAMLALIVDTFYEDATLCVTNDSQRIAYKTQQPKPKQAKITDTLSELSVKLYPNPAKDYAILSVLGEVEGPLQLIVTDALGRAVLNNATSFTNGKYRINTGNFSNGLYYVTLYNQTGKLFTGKLSIFK